MAIDHIGRADGWGRCPDCNAPVKLSEIAAGFRWPIIRHEETCPLMREATC